MENPSPVSRALSLRVQLLISHLVLVLLLGFVMSVGVGAFFTVSRALDRVLQENFRSVMAVQMMRDSLDKQRTAFDQFLAERPEDAGTTFEREWARFGEALEVAEDASTDDAQKRKLGQVKDVAVRYEAAIRRALNSRRGDVETRVEILNQAVDPRLGELIALSDEFLDINQSQIARENEAVKGQVRRAAFGSLLVSIVAIALAVLLTMRMVRVALTPLEQLAKTAERIGAGDLNERIQTRRKDEIGILAESFNHMADKLREVREKEERRLHRAEAMSDAALQSLYDPVVVSDQKGRIVHLNRAAEGLFGPAPQVPRRPVVEHIGDRRIVRAIERAVKDESISASEDDTALVPIKVGGTERTYRLRATPMKDADGALLGSVAVLEDITHLRELDRLKTEFVGVASHELRTPVTSLLLAVQLLLEGAAGDLNDSQREVVQTQKADLERLDKLMKDLLDMTRLEAGTSPPRFELVGPAELVQSAIASVRAAAEKRGLSLVAHLDPDLPPVRADRSQILRVFANLLNNAIRHTLPGGSISMRATAAGDQVRFEVSDTGSGIPKEYLGRIFERFVQVPGATGGGAGLGLSISKTIVEAHGGTMSAESEVGTGSTFAVALPVGSGTRGEETL